MTVVDRVEGTGIDPDALGAHDWIRLRGRIDDTELIDAYRRAWLVVSGNFSWLNATTMILAASAFGDDTLERVLPVDPRAGAPDPATWFTITTLVLVVVVAWLSVPVVRNLLSRRQRMNASFTIARKFLASFSNRVGRHAYKASVENGLSPVRDRDELYLTIKYTF